MTLENRIAVGKYIAYLLRHSPESAGLVMDAGGWVDASSLVQACRVDHKGFSLKALKELVLEDSKKRYTLSGGKIRANQGHSVLVDLGLIVMTPTNILYHGTATRFLESIRHEGLKPMGRQHVHLSDSIQQAMAVGQRHGSPVVLPVHTGIMNQAFFLSDNGVWLTEGNIDPCYICFDEAI
jgi:putative RNA 2'-phosphotransferase